MANYNWIRFSTIIFVFTWWSIWFWTHKFDPAKSKLRRQKFIALKLKRHCPFLVFLFHLYIQKKKKNVLFRFTKYENGWSLFKDNLSNSIYSYWIYLISGLLCMYIDCGESRKLLKLQSFCCLVIWISFFFFFGFFHRGCFWIDFLEVGFVVFLFQMLVVISMDLENAN